MQPMDAATAFGMLLAGCVWAFFVGSVLGNLATNPIYRLPRGMPVTKEKPFCDTCHTPLTPRDLFPIFSWLLAKGRCRYCTAPVPATYFWIEFSFALLHICAFLRLGFGEAYLLLTSVIGALFAAAAMLMLSNYRSWRTLAFAFVPSLLWAALRDGTLLAPLQGLLLVGPLLLFGMYFQQEKARPDLAAPLLRHGLALWVLGMWAHGLSNVVIGLCSYVFIYCLATLCIRAAARREAACVLALAGAILSIALF